MDQHLPSIEDMSLESLQENITELSDDELLAYVQTTRNARNEPAKKKRKKGKQKSPELTQKQNELVALLAATGLTLEDLLGDDE